jgi:hypothetical protein
MADLSPRLMQKTQTPSTPASTAYILEINSNYTLSMITAGGATITAKYFSSYPPYVGQTVHYVIDNQGNYVVVGGIADEQSKAMAFIAKKTTDTTLYNDTVTKIDFDSVDYDGNSLFNFENSKFTAPLPGIYSVSSNQTFTANGTGVRTLSIAQEVSTDSSLTVTTWQRTSGSANVTVNITGVGAILSAGTSVLIEGMSVTLNGVWTIASITTNAFVFASNATTALSGSGGTVTKRTRYLSFDRMITASSSLAHWSNTSGVCQLDKGDRVYVVAQQNSTATLYSLGNSPAQFCVYYIGPA